MCFCSRDFTYGVFHGTSGMRVVREWPLSGLECVLRDVEICGLCLELGPVQLVSWMNRILSFL